VESQQRLLSDLRVFDVAIEDADVIVSVYGGSANACGAVRFTLAEAAERQRYAQLARGWVRDNVPVTLRQAGGDATLVNERALLDRALTP
jgi:hypothetical protein